ncbi:MAG: site-specific tyrosine recombinase XerD [Candidatus Cloacimonetes bacterium]|nr:site-specific tyrosine recombinase XerD [Candidatus Cloacimonadota bacterium]
MDKKMKNFVSKENQVLINKFKFYLKVEKGLANNTLDSYLSDIERFAEFLGKNKLDEIDPSFLEEYINTLYKRGLEDSTVARRSSSLKNFYKFLHSEDIISIPIYEKFPSPQISQKLPVVLTEQEVDNLLQAVKLKDKYGIRDRALLEFVYSTGARVSEVISLRKSDIDFDQQIVRIFGKGRKERFVPIARIAAKYCKTYMENARLEFLKGKNSNIFFLNRFGDKLSRMGIWKIFAKYVKLADIEKHVSPHTLRHSFATHLLKGGANLRVVQTLLGHSSINTTQIYTNIDQSYLQEVHKLYHPRA